MGGLGDAKKFHLMDWNVVCSLIHEGGLGIKQLSYFNQELLGKWLWRFRMKWEQLWRSIVVAKYGEEDTGDLLG